MKSNLEKRDLISTRYAGKLSGYTSSYLRRLLRSGEVEGVQIGRVWMVKRASLIRFLDTQAARKEELSLKRSRIHAAEYRAHAAPKRPIPPQGKSVPIQTAPVHPQPTSIGEFLRQARATTLVSAVFAFIIGSLVVQGVIAPQVAKVASTATSTAVTASPITITDITATSSPITIVDVTASTTTAPTTTTP